QSTIPEVDHLQIKKCSIPADFQKSLLSRLVTHCSLHRRNDLFADPFFTQLFNLRCREIKLNRRILDASDNRSFGKSSFDELANRIIRQTLCLLEFGCCSSSFRWRTQDTDCGRAGRYRVVGSRTSAATRFVRTLAAAA